MKISQAVGMGFLVMGAIGYFIKLSTSCSSTVGKDMLTHRQYTSR